MKYACFYDVFGQPTFRRADETPCGIGFMPVKKVVNRELKARRWQAQTEPLTKDELNYWHGIA